MALEVDLSNLQFLLVDNDVHMRTTITDILRHFGVRGVAEADDGEAAFEMLDQVNPDIILTEYELPKMSGLDLVQKIRKEAEEAHRVKPIIILSAHTQQDQVMEARDSGATEYLAKPVDSSTIYKRICSVVIKPRPFIELGDFAGPDRRRRHDPYMVGQARRQDDAGELEGDLEGEINEDEIEAMLGL